VDPARHQERRRQIIDAAAGVFAARGLDGATTAEICRAARMSPGNLFHYFPSKREVFLAVITDGEDDKRLFLAAAVSAADPWRSLVDVVDHLVAPATDPLGPPLVVEAMIQARRDPELAGWLRRDEAEERTAIMSLVTRATAAGRIDPGVEPAVATSWISSLVGAFHLRAASDPGFEAEAERRVLHLGLARFLRAAEPDPPSSTS
jgi:AcrR family transcriptional regulator